MNMHEFNARGRKVEAIVEYIDSVAAQANARGGRNAVKIRVPQIVSMLESWGEVDWAQAATEAKVKGPSPTSREAIIQVFKRRIAR